jgi:GT2 family glycosyltransferase
MKEELKVTIAIITRNRSESLARTLKALQSFNYPFFEIIVVNNDSDDATETVIKQFNVIYLFSKKHNGFSKSRQLAVNAATGDLILWCDDDCVPHEGWIEQFVKRFKESPTLGMAGGKIYNVGFPDSMVHKGTEIIVDNCMLKPIEDPYQATMYANLNLAMRTEALKRVGGYDPFFKGGYEEIDLNLMMRKAGYEIAYVPEAIVDHYHSTVSFKKGRFFFGGTLMRLYCYFKHRDQIGNKGFYKKELILLVEELWRHTKLVLSGFKRMSPRVIEKGLIELFNVISSRVCIPWLLIKSSKYRQSSI